MNRQRWRTSACSLAVALALIFVTGGALAEAKLPTTTDKITIPNTVVQFTHPLCSDCHRLERELRDEGRTVVTVDVRSQPQLARKYGVGVVPTAVTVDGSGAVLARLA